MSKSEEIRSGEDYFQKFDTQAYLKSYYSDVTTPWLVQVIKYLHKVFSSGKSFLLLDSIQTGRANVKTTARYCIKIITRRVRCECSD